MIPDLMYLWLIYIYKLKKPCFPAEDGKTQTSTQKLQDMVPIKIMVMFASSVYVPSTVRPDTADVWKHSIYTTNELDKHHLDFSDE